MQKRLLWCSLILFTAFFALNHAWTHAAIGRAFSDSACPPALVQQARRRVDAFFGDTASSPLLACLATPVLGLDVPYGSARFAPWLPTVIVLGPDGLNVDVMAHEWAHAELAARTSALLRTYKVPTWFDEGLAMQLDERSAYSRTRLSGFAAEGRFDALVQARSLSAIAKPSGFFVSGPQGAAHYALAKCVVATWLGRVPDDRLRQLVTEVGWHAEFPADEFLSAFDACTSFASAASPAL